MTRGGENTTALDRIMRSSVSPLTGMASCWARRDPGSPPNAKPIWRCMSPRRAVRRARGGPTSGRRSVKICRGQLALVHRNRLART